MLVLSRSKNQTVRIGDEIELTVVRISGNKVRIGIKAPESTPVLRQELVDSPQEGSSVQVRKVRPGA